eukprot:2100724-Prymnesium_polylepis.1
MSREQKQLHGLIEEKIGERSMSPRLNRLRREELELKSILQSNSETSIVQQRLQMQKLHTLRREYTVTCSDRREELQREYKMLDERVDATLRRKLANKLDTNVELKHKKQLSRMREIRAQLISLGESADMMYLRRANAALKDAVNSHPDVLSAEQSLLGMDSAEEGLHRAEVDLDAAEQRILICAGAPPESDLSAEEERDRVLSAVGPFDTLGVRRDCNSADITARYHELAKKLHSDRHGLSDAAMSKVNAARDVLNDPAQRTAYVTNNPLDGFNTSLSRAEQRARCAVEDARTSRVEWMMRIFVTLPLEETFKALGAATPCHINLTKRITTPPLQALIDTAHLLKVDRIDVIDELFQEIDEEDPAKLNVNQSSRIADLHVSVNGYSLRLPYEIVTLKNYGRLVFQDLAKSVLHASNVCFQAVVAQLREATLEH